MIKNTEWGAIVYLTNSEYGRYSKNICDEITRNNNNKWITGYAANNSLSYEEVNASSDGRYTYNYKNPLSQVASTTGNYTGIYDMSGGTFEYVMGVVVDGSPFYKLSGFTDNTFPKDLKYYDAYKSTNVFNYKCRILGDATGEMGPFEAISSYQSKGSWYNDQSQFIYTNVPWMTRGGNVTLGNMAGIFMFYRFSGNYTGGVGTRLTSRIVLVIK